MIDIEYEKLVASVPCPNCAEPIDVHDVIKTTDVSTFGKMGRKLRIVRCPVCRKEHQFVSER